VTLGARPGLRSRDGRLWFATANGLSVVNPMRSQPAPGPATRADRDGRDQRRGWEARGVPPGPGEVAIRFTAVSFRTQTKLRFPIAWRAE